MKRARERLSLRLIILFPGISLACILLSLARPRPIQLAGPSLRQDTVFGPTGLVAHRQCHDKQIGSPPRKLRTRLQARSAAFSLPGKFGLNLSPSFGSLPLNTWFRPWCRLASSHEAGSLCWGYIFMATSHFFGPRQDDSPSSSDEILQNNPYLGSGWTFTDSSEQLPQPLQVLDPSVLRAQPLSPVYPSVQDVHLPESFAVAPPNPSVHIPFHHGQPLQTALQPVPCDEQSFNPQGSGSLLTPTPITQHPSATHDAGRPLVCSLQGYSSMVVNGSSSVHNEFYPPQYHHPTYNGSQVFVGQYMSIPHWQMSASASVMQSFPPIPSDLAPQPFPTRRNSWRNYSVISSPHHWTPTSSFSLQSVPHKDMTLHTCQTMGDDSIPRRAQIGTAAGFGIPLPARDISQPEAGSPFENHPSSNFADLGAGVDSPSYPGEGPQMVDPEAIRGPPYTASPSFMQRLIMPMGPGSLPFISSEIPYASPDTQTPYLAQDMESASQTTTSSPTPYLDIPISDGVVVQLEAGSSLENHPSSRSNFADLAVGVDGLSHAAESTQVVDPESAPHTASPPFVQLEQVPMEHRAPCQWRGGDGLVCGEPITHESIPEHLPKHGIEKMSRNCRTTCHWDGCEKTINRECLVRHFREVHLRGKRRPAKRVQKPA
ncbi:hypothetical protein HD554DRAFT_2060061 [Boletus coccyginus]|nr:hypothetical protein HD554DRAFT_2060061 [Boletus coccyginus]